MIAKRVLEKCINCNICEKHVNCPKGNLKNVIETDTCIGCGACVITCPQEALILKDVYNKKNKVCTKEVFVNGNEVFASGTVKHALEAYGLKISKIPDFKNQINDQIFIPCDCGGCWACITLVNGRYAPVCITPLKEGMKIETNDFTGKYPVLRVISSFGAHSVGGVGTPYQLKNIKKPIEVIGYTHGCNLRCPQCQNFPIALTAGGNLLEANETSEILLGLKELHQVNRITLSGGESTLNRKWLIEVIKQIKFQNKDVKIHVDTNGTILTLDYIDDLVKAGMTDIGIDLKSMDVSTYMHITGLLDEKVAEKYLKTSWKAVEYIIDNYLENIFIGIGIPYNKSLISKKEVQKMGKKIFKLKSDVQVCVLDYRPEFRRKDLVKPSFNEMIEIKNILNNEGLETVIIQTSEGHFGP